MALPNEFAYNQLKPASAPARGYTARLFPEAGTVFQGGSIINIDIPAGRPGEYLRATESSLFMTIKNVAAYGGAAASDANTGELSGGAYAVIKKLEVFHGASLLESIDNYATLHSMLYDMTTSSNHRQGVGNMIHGTADVALGSTTVETLEGATLAQETSLNAGDGGEITVALQLVSSLVGQIAERAIPLGLMSSDLRIQITLNPDSQSMVSTTGTPILQFTNVEYHAVMVSLDPTVDQEVAANNDGVLAMHSSSFRAYTHTIANGTPFDVIQLPVRFSSLRYMLHALQPASNIDTMTKRGVEARETANLIKFQYRAGSILVPQRPVEFSATNAAEVTVELLKIMGKLSSLGDDFGVVLTDKSTFQNNNVATGTADQGTFIFGADLNPFGGNLDDLSNTGSNFLSTPVSLELHFSGSGTPHTVRMSTFASFDQIMMLDLATGLLSVRF